ncbi:MAG: UDP-N-acetylglucosamine 2-epimerase (non-hydrolyzing) [Candidatus Burarchaeum sp.]|nr:UDP-N-acetylglucosamine 2-epimerase (non-hydrolyzing) [Candidatus Burarchaeum sp.]MDO8340220.1 UDP-N-acetylglucosamine 2-epimerase (non-hydrolyzing) [Candidatus Burarchaeum sp.]
MKIMHAFGTRACSIKMAPLVRESLKRGHDTKILYSGQHYSSHLYEEVFDDLELPRPDYDIEARGTPAEMGARMIVEAEKILKKEKPDIILTHGDTFTAMFLSLAGALALTPVGHVEAGLRTNSWEPYPEQICTRTNDACSALFFAATAKNQKALLSEGAPADRIFVVGNTIVDAALQNAEIARRKSRILEELKLTNEKNLIFWSVHRKENMLHEERMRGIFESLLDLKEYKIFCSVLPSTQQAAERYGYADQLAKAKHLIWVPCLPKYTDALRIMLESKLILTDSGGLQEEGCSLDIPCLTIRYVTDRPESIEAGANRCVGTEKDSICEWTRKVMEDEKLAQKMRNAPNPYGDGKSAGRIIDIIEKFEGKMERWEKKIV